MIHDDMLSLVGNTPLVRIQRVKDDIECEVVAKLEAFNPAGSVKERTALNVILEAEKSGALKPGGTIVEATSGNMGVGIAFIAAVRGYKSVVVTMDKQAPDKINLAKAFGAKVRICPTAVEPDDPRSFYSVAKRIAAETPDAFFANQFFNADNPAAHYKTTGPEIWEQTEGKVDALVGGLGTGGSLCGTGRYLKEKNPAIQVVVVDPKGSLFYDYFHTKTMVKPEGYLLEGIGEDILPSTLDFSVLDDCLQVHDGESFRMARRLAREEGILSGGSSGAAMVGALRYARSLPAGKVVVVLLCERGERALGKIFNDEWMREKGLIPEGSELSAKHLLERKDPALRDLMVLGPDALVSAAIHLMQEHEISQIPIVDGGQLVGTVREDQIIDLLLHTPARKEGPLSEVMEDPLPEADEDATLEEIQETLAAGHSAVIVRGRGGRRGILTKYDLIQALSR